MAKIKVRGARKVAEFERTFTYKDGAPGRTRYVITSDGRILRKFWVEGTAWSAPGWTGFKLLSRCNGPEAAVKVLQKVRPSAVQVDCHLAEVLA